MKHTKETTFDSFTYIVVDNPTKKVATAAVHLWANSKMVDSVHITVWSGADYDSAGDWTEEEIKNRIQTLITA